MTSYEAGTGKVSKVNVKSFYPSCKRDGSPMLTINGRFQCVSEYLDRCIGNQEVIDIIQRDETVYYVFENGHELPMLCFCCGDPLNYHDLEQARRQMLGRRLESMSFGVATVEDSREAVEFVLEFSKRGWRSRQVDAMLTPEVARFLRHPPNCPHQKQKSNKKRRRKKKR